MSFYDSISVSGTIFSLVGVVLTFCTLVTAQTIQKDLQRRHRLPALLEALRSDMSDFNDLLNRHSGLESPDMRSTLGRMSVNLKSAYAKQKIAEVKTAMVACQKLMKHGLTDEGTFENLYGLMAAAIAAIENYVKDIQWRVIQ